MKNLFKRVNFPRAGVAVLAGIFTILPVTACQSPNNPQTGTARYSISIRDPMNGTVSADKKTAGAGETVTLYVSPDDNYQLDSLRISGVSGIGVISQKTGVDYTFIMPGEDVVITTVFTGINLAKYGITINTMENGTFEVIPESSQYETYSVELIARPDAGYKYRPGTLRVTGRESHEEIPISREEDSDTEWAFLMPGEDVEVNAGFIDKETELYDINITQTANGSVDCGQSNSAAGDMVTLTLRCDNDFRCRSGSLTVMSDDGKLIEVREITGGGMKWFFIMPESTVNIKAVFEEIPSYSVTVTDPEHGKIAVEPPETARAGDKLYVSLSVYDPENYRYAKNSFTVTTDSGNKLDFEILDDYSWSFTMPEEAVTLNAALEFIPYFSITVNNTENGSFTVSGAEVSGSYAGMAREGAVITVTAIPHSGYKLTDTEPAVMPAGAVSLAKLEDQSAWIFNMGEKDIEISVNFAELDPLEIYKGGLRKGITADKLTDGYTYYEDAIEFDAEIPVNNGLRKVIKIKSAINANGNAVQQSFGLFSDTEIDLENAAALSFRAKANKQLNIRFIGFGGADPNKRVVYTGENYNQSIAVSAEWKRYVVPVPAPNSGQKTTRVFFLGALIAKDNYIYIDDIEFIHDGVTLSGIQIAETNTELFCGATDAGKLLKGSPIKLSYECGDGTTVTLQNANNKHQMEYNLAYWLEPYLEASGNITFLNGKIIPKEKNSGVTLTVKMSGKSSNPMTANIIDGLLIDDFEGMESVSIQAAPEESRGYLWHSAAAGSVIKRDYFTEENAEIHSGLAAGNWRPTATAKNSRGGRNFEEKDLSAYNTLIFRIRVTAGTTAGTNFHRNTAFTFGLKNGGTLTSNNDNAFIKKEFIYDTDGWQEVKMKLSDFIDTGLDINAVTGYAFSIAENQNTALRIALDDIVVVNE